MFVVNCDGTKERWVVEVCKTTEKLMPIPTGMHIHYPGLMGP